MRFLRWQRAEIYGQPGAIFDDQEGRPVFVVSLDMADDLVQTVRAISNPEKLKHLGAGRLVTPPSD